MIVFAIRGTDSVAKYLECHLLLKQLLLFFVDEGDFSFVAKN